MAVFVCGRHYLQVFFVLYLFVLNCFMWFNFPPPIGMIHIGVYLSCLPVRTTLLFWYFTTTYFLRKVTSVPLSHTTRIENKGLVIHLNTAAFFICVGSAGILNYTLAVDCMFVLLAHWTSIGWCSIFLPGKFGGTQIPVAAVLGCVVSCFFTISDANCLVLSCLLLLLL